MRVAWFTPLPPVRSGICAYSLEILPLLAGTHDIDVFVDDEVWRACEPRASAGRWPTRNREARLDTSGRVAVIAAHDFVFRHDQRPYDLIVYQLGNARCHDYMWPYLMRFPGLVVLHDGQVHLARAALLLGRARQQDYRDEFRWNHPDVRPAVAEYAVAGLPGASYYFYPMVRGLMTRARLTAVHNAWLAGELAQIVPSAEVDTIAMGVAPGPPPAPRPGPPEGGPVFAAFGVVTPEKRIPQLLRAFAALTATVPHARLLLVGETVPHYDAAAAAAALGIDDRVTITGYVPDADLPNWLRHADVCVCLRWPSSRETSASWLRALAAGKPTIVTDLVHLVDTPSLDPRSWTVLHAAIDAGFGEGRTESREPLCVSIDIVDEDHSLRLAMHRLAIDGPLRAQLGRAALATWRYGHTLEHMARDYDRVLARAAGLPAPPAPTDMPAHLLADGTSRLTGLLGEMGLGEMVW